MILSMMLEKSLETAKDLLIRLQITPFTLCYIQTLFMNKFFSFTRDLPCLLLRI